MPTSSQLLEAVHALYPQATKVKYSHEWTKAYGIEKGAIQIRIPNVPLSADSFIQGTEEEIMCELIRRGYIPPMEYEMSLKECDATFDAATPIPMSDEEIEQTVQQILKGTSEADRARKNFLRNGLRMRSEILREMNTNRPMKNWEIWCEGYSATGDSGTHHKIGEALGITFKNACDAYAERHEAFRKFYDFDRNTYWGCRLFPTAEEAARSFG